MSEHGTFTCAQCHQTFPQAWSDEEMTAEALVHGFDPENDAVVCDDCFKILMAAANHPIGQPRPDEEPS